MARLNRWVRVFLRYWSCLLVPRSDLNHDGFGDQLGGVLFKPYLLNPCFIRE